MKDPREMSAAEFKRTARHFERKYPGHIPLSAFPGLRRVKRKKLVSELDPILKMAGILKKVRAKAMKAHKARLVKRKR